MSSHRETAIWCPRHHRPPIHILAESVHSVKQKTFENYEYVVRVHLTPALGHLKLKALTPAHVQGLYRSKLDSGLSARTVRPIHTTLHKALKQAVRWNLVPRNVTEAAIAPRLVKKESRSLTPGQARTYLETAGGDRLEALSALAVTADLREGELLGLRWQDIDLERGALRVRQQLTRTRQRLSFTSPKNGKSRGVRFIRGAVLILKRHRKHQNKERLKLGTLWQDSQLVCATPKGTPLDVGNLTYRSFRPLLERAGLPRSASTTCATPSPRSCCPGGHTPKWSKGCSGTPRSPRQWTPTPMSGRTWE